MARQQRRLTVWERTWHAQGGYFSPCDPNVPAIYWYHNGIPAELRRQLPGDPAHRVHNACVFATQLESDRSEAFTLRSWGGSQA